MFECFVSSADAPRAVPVHGVGRDDIDAALARLSPGTAAWARLSGFDGASGSVLTLPDEAGAAAAVLLGLGRAGEADPLVCGALAPLLPAGDYTLSSGFADSVGAVTAFALGAYRYGRYRTPAPRGVRLVLPDALDRPAVERILTGVYLARDLINTPANDLGPEELAAAAVDLARRHGARIEVIAGDALLDRGFPLVHAVGRASDRAPRLVDLVWGDESHPKVTLVGKGVCFDTGGLNIKPDAGMLLMKKDMGGAAAALGLAEMVMAAGLPVRLRVIVPAVENAISGAAFRPGDVYKSRKGLSVEIGNTDAEGRLVLADALALADEEAPDLIIDFATLTGAARVALGPDLPPLYTDDDGLAADVARHGAAIGDPVWRMPLWRPYARWLDSKIADVNHISSTPFAGSITAALFLGRFVEKAGAWAHFDIFGWTPSARPGRPEGGEPQAIRAVFALLGERYGGGGR